MKLEDTKTSSRLTQIISLVVLTIAGTLTGVLGAFTMGVGDMMSITDVLNAGFSRTEADSWAYVAEFSTDTAQVDYVTRNTVLIAVSVVVFLAALIIFCVNTVRLAKTPSDVDSNSAEAGKVSYELSWWDRIWSEVHIILLIATSGLAIAAAAPIFDLVRVSEWVGIMKPIGYMGVDTYFYGIDNNVVLGLCIAGMAACIAAAALCAVTLIKKIAAKKFIKNSLLGKILVLLGIGAKYAGHGASAAGKGLVGATRTLWVPSNEDKHAIAKLVAKYIVIFTALITAPWFFAVFISYYSAGPLTLFVWFVAVVFAGILIYKKVRKIAEIRAGVIEVKSGNLTYKINVVEDINGPKTDLDKLASDINHISEATNIAVQNEIKNQRLKTDLISNVSHDLKTPLTSMISYLDILEKEGLDSPDAPQHLAIVQEKTERLKTLTEELFEAAKASSGNIPCEITNIDMSALIDQSLAEMGDRLEKKNLDIRKSIKVERAMVKADGKLLYRVLENLLGNISKYALEGSRVYIDVTKPVEHLDKLLLEVKNISKEELNISADELMERFTRGDKSRNTEGSGLGLAIAKDLTKNMGGVFEISIDGDMFKASVLLDEA